MLTGTDVAREIVASRQAEARQAALGTAIRLARRQRRLSARIERMENQLSGQ